MKNLLSICCAATLLFSSLVWSAEDDEEIEAKSIVELLQLVRDGKISNRRLNENREREFLADRASQQRSVRNAEAAQPNRKYCRSVWGRCVSYLEFSNKLVEIPKAWLRVLL